MAKETCVHFFRKGKWQGADCPKRKRQRKQVKETVAYYQRKGFTTDVCTTHRVKRSGRWVFVKTVCRKRGLLRDGQINGLGGRKRRRKRAR